MTAFICTECRVPDAPVVAVAPGREPERAVGVVIDAGEPMRCRCWRCWCAAYGGTDALPARVLP